ncbi:MAG: response regulator [Acidobacteria bacterium]|nr:response regulator [Acidobacteriota bacterium]
MAKLLLVGDDPAEREVLGLVIEFGGHRCRLAVSLEEAVKLLQREFFDLVITDIKQDRRSSRQIVKGLKAASAKAAVMILTESGDTDAKEADAIVAIPCSPKNLLQRIEHVLKKTVAPAGKRSSGQEKEPPAEAPWRRAAKV